MIRINSEDRFSGTSYNFDVHVSRELENTKGRLLVKKIVIPRTWYEIDNTNNRIDFIENVGIEANATITIGHYNANTLATEIGTQMTAVSPNARTYTCTYNSTTRKFSIVVSAGTTSLLFLTGAYTSTSARKVMGFTKSDTSSSLTNTSDQIIDINSNRYNIDVISNINIDEKYNATTGSNIYNVITTIPVDIAFGEIIVYEPHDVWLDAEFTQGKNIHFELRFSDGNFCDINGLNWYIELILDAFSPFANAH